MTNNFAVLDGKYLPAAKANLEAYLQQLQSLRGISASNHEIADLYATSVFLYATTNFWADAVSGTDFIVKYKGSRVDPEHPLQKLLNSRGDMYRRSEVSRMMWGRNLLWKRRNGQGRIYDLRWINPTLYAVDAGSTGLRGFKVYPGRYAANATNYIKPQDAIYTHEIDFDDDFDGIAAAEVAFLQASAETELATTALAWFRNNMFMSGIFQPAEGVTGVDDGKVNRFIALLKGMFRGAVNAGRSLVQNSRWEYIQIQQDFDKVALKETYESIRQNVSIATNVPVEFVTTGQATYAEIKGKVDLWYQLRLKPVVGRQADAFTKQLASEYGDDYTVEADITPLMISDPKEQAELVEQKIESIVIDLYSAQQELGIKNPDINLKGLYRVNGIPVPSEHLREIWQYQLGSGAAIAKATPMYDITALAQSSQPQLPPTTESPTTASASIKATAKTDTPRPAYAYIPLPNNADVLRVQRQLKERLADERIEWQIPSTFHVTLCFADSVSDAVIDQISKLVNFTAFEMEAAQGEELAYFETPDGKALHIPILLTNLLGSLQASVYQIFEQTSAGISEFSIPENYNPHITLAYLPGDIAFDFRDYREIANPLSSALIPVEQVIVSRDNYDPALIVSAAQRIKSALKPLIPDDQYKELKDWRQIAQRKGEDYPFEARVLPEKAVKFIDWGLSTDAALEDIFTAAENLLRQTPDDTWLVDSYEAVQRAAKSDATKAIEDTRARFISTFKPILQELNAGTLTSTRAQVLIHAQLERFERMAYLDGLISGGIPDAQMTLQDFRALASLTTKQKQFASQFISRALSDGIGDVSAKAHQWFNGSVYPFYVEGQRNGIDNPNEIWTMDEAKENCFPSGTQVATANGHTPIEEVEIGDYVLTNDGYRRVMNTMVNPFEGNLYEITQGEYRVQCTPNHPFLTGRGWIQAKDLQRSDYIVTEKDILDVLSGNIALPDTNNPVPAFRKVGILGFVAFLLSNLSIGKWFKSWMTMPIFPVGLNNNVADFAVNNKFGFGYIIWFILNLQLIKNLKQLLFKSRRFIALLLGATIQKALLDSLVAMSTHMSFIGFLSDNGVKHRVIGQHTLPVAINQGLVSNVFFQRDTENSGTVLNLLHSHLHGSSRDFRRLIGVGHTQNIVEFFEPQAASIYTIGAIIACTITYMSAVWAISPLLATFGIIILCALWSPRLLLSSISDIATGNTTEPLVGLDSGFTNLALHRNNSLSIRLIPTDIVPVYNLEVQGNHQYVANGLLAHNCNSCKALDGQVHRRSSWNEKGLYPNSNKLICGPGNKCGCKRTVTAEKARGRFLSANLVAAEHAH